MRPDPEVIEGQLARRMRANRAKAAHVEMFDQSGEEGSADVVNGVTVHWLKPVFRLDVETIRRRLADCPVKGLKRGNIKVYDLATAASYLVTPRMDVEALLKQLKPTQLPPNLQPAIWSARLKQQAWEEKAGDLWPTHKVVDVFAEVNRTIRQTIQLWMDDIERTESFPPKLLANLTAKIDALQEDLYTQLVALPTRQRTESLLASLSEIAGAANDDDGVV